MNTQILPWDSDFFGFRTARIFNGTLAQEEIKQSLCTLREAGVRLVYWSSDQPASFDIASLHGRLVDRKVTYSLELSSLKPDLFILLDRVKSFSLRLPQADMLDLAVQAGQYSRFACDPDFPQELFIALYQEWIKKSITRELADEILVIEEDSALAAMLTIVKREFISDIGLIAVKPAFRGKKFGEMLVRAAQLWSIQQGLQQSWVVTQKDNLPACRLYEKCDYRIQKIEYYYHFWLGQN